MKRRKVKLLALFLSVLLTALMAAPVLSEPVRTPPELTEYDQEMLLAFWQQPAYDGLTNGEAVYDIHLEDYNFLLEPAPVYDGSYWTRLLESNNSSGT